MTSLLACALMVSAKGFDIDAYYKCYESTPFPAERFAKFYAESSKFRESMWNVDRVESRQDKINETSKSINVPGGYEQCHLIPHRTIQNSDVTLVEGTFTGVFKGKTFALRFLQFFRTKDGLIIEQADYFDGFAFLAATGGAPESFKENRTPKTIKIPAESGPTPSPDTLEKSVRKYFSEFTGDYSGVNNKEWLTPESCWLDVMLRINCRGSEDIRKQIFDREGHAYYTDAKAVLNSVVPVGSSVYVEGRQSGKYLGNPFDVGFASILTFRQGHIALRVDYSDVMGWLKQVGKLPKSASL